MNLALYAVTVLIWGTTWIAIKWQLGSVPPPVSIAWRFWIAALVLFALLRIMRRPIWPPRAAWRYPGRARFRAVLPELPVLLLRRADRAERPRRRGVFHRAAVEFDQRTDLHGPSFAADGDCRRVAGPGRHRVSVRSADGGAPRRSRRIDSALESRFSAPCASRPATCCRAGCNRWACTRSPPIAGRC